LNTNNQKILIQIFKVVFDISEEKELQSIRKLTDDRWDSLRHVSLIAALESEFGLKLDTSEMELITSYKAAKVFLEEKGL
tara:strand:+ start:134 stop:373 length:240 start_codon:yes stop_codon:yes gene_type:complete